MVAELTPILQNDYPTLLLPELYYKFGIGLIGLIIAWKHFPKLH